MNDSHENAERRMRDLLGGVTGPSPGYRASLRKRFLEASSAEGSQSATPDARDPLPMSTTLEDDDPIVTDLRIFLPPPGQPTATFKQRLRAELLSANPGQATEPTPAVEKGAPAASRKRRFRLLAGGGLLAAAAAAVALMVQPADVHSSAPLWEVLQADHPGSIMVDDVALADLDSTDELVVGGTSLSVPAGALAVSSPWSQNLAFFENSAVSFAVTEGLDEPRVIELRSGFVFSAPHGGEPDDGLLPLAVRIETDCGVLDFQGATLGIVSEQEGVFVAVVDGEASFTFENFQGDTEVQIVESGHLFSVLRNDHASVYLHFEDEMCPGREVILALAEQIVTFAKTDRIVPR